MTEEQAPRGRARRVWIAAALIATAAVVVVVASVVPSDRPARRAGSVEVLRLTPATLPRPVSDVMRNWKSADDHVHGVQMSGDGRFLLFTSAANNLVKGDTNRCAVDNTSPAGPCADAFVRDMTTGSIERVSVSSSGRQGNEVSEGIGISADGRFVTFESIATSLVPNDKRKCADLDDIRPCRDVFLHDRATGRTTRVSESASGEEANDFSSGGSISADGRYIVFSSKASNLVEGDPLKCPRRDPMDGASERCSDVFLYDRVLRSLKRVSVPSDGSDSNGGSSDGTVSGDGRFVLFSSGATNLTPAGKSGFFVYETASGKTTMFKVASLEGASHLKISGDGNTIISDDNTSAYVYDRLTRKTQKIPGRLGTQIWAEDVSADGRYVALWSNGALTRDDTNTGDDCFVVDRSKRTIARFTAESTNAGIECWVSSDGRTLAFLTPAGLVLEDADAKVDVYLRDRETGRIRLAS